MNKIFSVIFVVIVMAVLNSQVVFAQNAKNGWELEIEDGTHPKNPLLQLTGFVPQTRTESKKRNLSRQEFWDFVNGYKKPSKIIPSNPYWASQWTVYAAHGKKQLVFLMKEATRNYSLSDQELVRLFFREANEVLVTDSVLSTGIAYWKKNGVVEGVGWTEKRNFYKTGDGGERMLVFEGEYGIVRFSLTCGNSFMFEPKTPLPKPEPIIPDVGFCPTIPDVGVCPPGQGLPSVGISYESNGSHGVQELPSVGGIGSGNQTGVPSVGQENERSVQHQNSVSGMVPAQSAGPVKRK